MLIFDILMFAAGIFLLIKGSDFFVDAGSEIGKTFKISEILLGLTLVSFGTSLPELIIAITGAQSGNNNIAIGNIIGTNIFNICAILGTICIINPIKFLRGTVRKDMYMSLLSAVTLTVLLLDVKLGNGVQNTLSRIDGLILLLFFGVFMYYTLYEFTEYMKERKRDKNTEVKLKLKDIDKVTKDILLMILGLAMVFIGGDLVVDATTDVAEKLHISETFIAIAIIAVGTSLPEIFTSIAAIKKGKENIAIGNLIGSNMFNTLFILGLASTINPIVLPMDSLLIDCGVFVLACLLLIIWAKRKGQYELSKLEGCSLVAIYLAYITYVIIRR